MSAKLLLDGYYYSQVLPWEDWHAGVRMHGSRVHYRRFYPNFNWLGSYRDHAIPFWNDSQGLTQEEFESVKRGNGPTTSEYDPLWIGGTYEVDGDRLWQHMAPDIGGGYVWESEFRIMDDRIVGVGGTFVLLFKPGQS